MKQPLTIITYLVFFVALLSFFSCENEVAMNKNAIVKIYTQPVKKDYKAMSAHLLNDGRSLIYGLVASNLETKFDDVQKELYLMMTDKNGRRIYDKVHTVEGDAAYPTKLIQIGNSYYTFWTAINGNNTQLLRIDVAENDFNVSTVGTVNFDKRYQSNHIVFADSNLDDDGFAALVISSEQYEGATLYTSRFITINSNGVVEEQKGEYDFTLTNIGAKNTNELLRIIDNYTFFIKDKERKRYCINTPYNNTMALVFAGDNAPVFSDSNYWVAGASSISDNNIDIIVSTANNFNQEVYYVTNVEPYPHNANFSQYKSAAKILSNIDLKYKIFFSSELIIGTSASSKYVEYKIGNFSSPLFIGDTYPYEVEGVGFDNQQIVVVGNTVLKQSNSDNSEEIKRIFLIRKDNL